jgi:multiple sugar transport system permease protein
MSTETTRRPLAGRTISEIGLAVVALLFLSPIVFTVATSLKDPGEIFQPRLFGDKLNWHNYVEVFTYNPFQIYIRNGLIVAGLGTLLVVVTAALSGYAFASLRWRGRDRLFLLYLATLMIPQEVLVVPMYLLMQRLGWINTFQALIVPWAFTAFGTFLLRQFYRGIPYELQEAARIDGCGPFRTFWNIMVPIARPALAVLAVWTFITYWNSFLWPLVVINDVNALGTVPIGLQLFFGEHGNAWHLVMAASVVSIAPTLLLVLLLQKHLVKGIATAGLGGR